MDNTTALIDTHLAAYCEPDHATRLDLLERVWNANGQLLDPPLDGTGIDAIAELTDAVLALYPKHRFVRTTEVDAHHGFARYGWSLVDPTGTPAVTGIDVAELDDDGKLVRIVGFFGDLASVEERESA